MGRHDGRDAPARPALDLPTELKFVSDEPLLYGAAALAS